MHPNTESKKNSICFHFVSRWPCHPPEVQLVEQDKWTYMDGRPLKVPGIDSGVEAI